MSSKEDCASVSKRPKLAITEDGLEGADATGEKVGNNNEQNNSSVENSSSSSTVETDHYPISVPGSDPVTSIVGNRLFSENERLGKLRKCWEGAEEENLEDGCITIHQIPYRHGELGNFIENQDFVHQFVKLFSNVEFHEKASDLFQFKQSDDMNSVVDPHVYAVNEYLSTKVLPFMKTVTGLPLNETVDMFLSVYEQTDFLLCHDDELDSRRIAFIWYLSENWTEEYGGTLDLFSSTDATHPDSIVKKVVPEFNKFVFFEVSASSFHQVSEVLKSGKRRLALSGWFYGEPLARPKIEFPVEKSVGVLTSMQIQEGILKKMCADMYLNPEIYTEINEQLSEESEVFVPGFLRDDVYEAICKAIVDTDVSKSRFSFRGPANVARYEQILSGPSENNSSVDEESTSMSIDTLWKLFYSKEFLQFMERITEFPFTTCPINKVASSLQKYSHGCYSLMKTGGAKQTGMASGLPEEQEVIEDEEEPNLVDVMFYFANKWKEECGGLMIYSTTDGEQLITVPPEGNCLAVVVRSSTVNSYLNYVNCLAKDDVFFVYKMTFAFDGNI